LRPSTRGAYENSPQFQLRVRSPKTIKPRRGGRQNVAGDSVAPPGLVIFMASKPAVETAGYSRLSLRDEASHHKPMVKKLERFVKFRPRPPLREIIRLAAD
jgi:hypothetical protein